MSQLVHRCTKCQCTVFTLAAPKSNLGGARINTGIKLATCMQCGNQDRPEEIMADEKGRITNERFKQEYLCEIMPPHQILLAKWLRKFNNKTGSNTP